MNRDSSDEKVRGAGITTRSGRKWAADKSVAQAESMLKLKDIIGNPSDTWRKKGEGQGLWNLDHKELGQSGTCPKRKIMWPELWRLEPFRIFFLFRSVYDTLPTPTNLHRWGMREDSLCKLRGGRGTLAHILAGCKTALSQGRYRWRHEKVLRVLADILEQERQKKTKKSLLQAAQSWEMRMDL
ncbi:unnamed protein product [Leuciscus chuanchicus]